MKEAYEAKVKEHGRIPDTCEKIYSTERDMVGLRCSGVGGGAILLLWKTTPTCGRRSPHCGEAKASPKARKC